MIRRTLPVALVVLALAGCSQVAALAPVGGDDVAEVRFATIDVLLDKGIEILEAPTCELAGTVITCAGTTTDGDAITATSSTDADATLEVAVGSATVFTGSLLDVLNAAVTE